jgi:hypothetical protein
VTDSAAQLPCHRCGYELAGLAEDGLCPECAAPIRETLAERSRMFGREDLMRVRLAAGILLVSFLCIGGLTAAFMIYWLVPSREFLPLSVVITLSAVGMIAWPIGWWVLGGAPAVTVGANEDRGAPVRMSGILSGICVAPILLGVLLREETFATCGGLLLIPVLPTTWLVGFGHIATLCRCEIEAPAVRRLALAANWAVPIGLLVILFLIRFGGPLFAFAALLMVGAVCVGMLFRHAHARLRG